jgi:hypothetical protein
MVSDYVRLYRRAIIEAADPGRGPHDDTRWSVL